MSYIKDRMLSVYLLCYTELEIWTSKYLTCFRKKLSTCRDVTMCVPLPRGKKQEDLAICLMHRSQATLRSGDERFGFDWSRWMMTPHSSVIDITRMHVCRKFGKTCSKITCNMTETYVTAGKWNKILASNSLDSASHIMLLQLLD